LLLTIPLQVGAGLALIFNRRQRAARAAELHQEPRHLRRPVAVGGASSGRADRGCPSLTTSDRPGSGARHDLSPRMHQVLTRLHAPPTPHRRTVADVFPPHRLRSSRGEARASAARAHVRRPPWPHPAGGATRRRSDPLLLMPR
jgi:hypothetical protein